MNGEGAFGRLWPTIDFASLGCSDVDCPWTSVLGRHEHKADAFGREYVKVGDR